MRLTAAFTERELQELRAEIPFSFRTHTTIGTGGDAAAALYPATAEAFAFAVRRLQDTAIPFLVLGRGSNVLASDSGYCGVVLKTDRMRKLFLTDRGVSAQCGVNLSRLLAFCAQYGRGGLHFLAGIPATVGGAVFMNAGAGGRFVAEKLSGVTALCGGEMRLFSAEECAFSYKHSRFMNGFEYVLAAEFSTEFCDKQSILRDIDRVLKQRSCLPRGRSMGCVFKNPPTCAAGALIERAGMKGASAGDAVVAQEHANFILNRGEASAAQIRSLIERVRIRVYEVCGVRLEEEIRYIGDF